MTLKLWGGLPWELLYVDNLILMALWEESVLEDSEMEILNGI